MKLLSKMKDGGPESTVTGYFLVEIKHIFTLVLLRFDGASREAYHTHAFNCINWLIKGSLRESFHNNYRNPKIYKPSLRPFIVRRQDFHKVDSETSRSWVLSFRGPWSRTWREYVEPTQSYRTLKNGRVVV